MIVRLGSVVVEAFSGGTPSSKCPDYWDGSIPWTTTSQLSSDLYLRSSARSISLEGLQKSSSRIAPAGSVLVGSRVGVGKTAVAAFDVAINQDLTALSLFTNRADPEYVAYVLRDPSAQSWFERCKRGATIKGIPRSALLDLRIPLPSLEEQRRIAQILSTIQGSRKAAKSEIDSIRAVKKAALQYLFVESAPMGGPHGWNTTNVGALCDGIYDGPHATPKKTESGPWFLSISSLDQGRLDLTKSAHLSERDWLAWTRRVAPRKDDVVFSYETRLGEVALIPAGLQACLGRRLALLRPDPTKVDPEFLMYAYLAPEFQTTLRERTVVGSTVQRLPLATFGDFPIRIPGLDRQRTIARTMRTFDRMLYAARKRLECLGLTRTVVLTHLMGTAE
jgi:restriction endonuclease S subunit